ncbi:MAG: hypothetical protein WCE94_00405 [Candidatus Methanoperedens sp.]
MNEALMEVIFPKLNHFWMDSGLLGLYRIAKDEKPEEMGVEIKLYDNGVLFKGTEANLDGFFHKTYDSLLTQYYNTSTQKQKDEKMGFYYDSKEDKFVRYPMVKTMGIAGLIFGKGPRPTKDKCKYEIVKVIESGKKTEKKILPLKYRHLQARFDYFLDQNKLKISSTTANLPIDGPNAYKNVPKVNIDVKRKKEKGICFLCGEPSHSLSDLKESTFPMISGSSLFSFVSGGYGAEKVCWKCDFISKYVPVSGFYTMNDGSYHIYFPYSSNFEKMNDVLENLHSVKIEDLNLRRNFNDKLNGYFPKPFEQLFSFLYSLYRIVMTKKASDSIPDDESEIDMEKLLDFSFSKAPVDFFVIHTEPLGKTQMGTMIWPFQNSVYFFRLIDRLERKKIDIKQIMNLLIDFEKDNGKTIIRNRICERILKKQGIVDLIEGHVFRINKTEPKNIKPLNDFVILYEAILNEDGGKMNQEIIDIAVSLGKTIGKSIGPSGKKGKGDLFRLRKARKPEEFLNEINRIQIKYDVSVTADLYNRGHDFENNFTEFKQFCMIAALNTFNFENSENKTIHKPNETIVIKEENKL